MLSGRVGSMLFCIFLCERVVRVDVSAAVLWFLLSSTVMPYVPRMYIRLCLLSTLCYFFGQLLNIVETYVSI